MKNTPLARKFQSFLSASQVSVFMPCQRDNRDVECRDDQKPHRVRNGESKELIRDKEDEHNDRDRITPKLFSKKTND